MAQSPRILCVVIAKRFCLENHYSMKRTTRPSIVLHSMLCRVDIYDGKLNLDSSIPPMKMSNPSLCVLAKN